MSHNTHYPQEKKGLHLGNNRQYNAFIGFLKTQNFGVPGTSLFDYEKFAKEFASQIWNIDPHYSKLKARYFCFPEHIEKKLLNFNQPTSHGHKAKSLSEQASTKFKITLNALISPNLI